MNWSSLTPKSLARARVRSARRYLPDPTPDSISVPLASTTGSTSSTTYLAVVVVVVVVVVVEQKEE